MLLIWLMIHSDKVQGLVDVDFADMRAIMKNAGSSLMGIGTATGKNRARDAALNAIQSPLLDIGIERATGIVWNLTGGVDLTLFEVNTTAEVIYDLIDSNANLIFGAVIDPSLNNQVSITLIATGFKGQDESERKATQVAHSDGFLGSNRRSFNSNSCSVEVPVANLFHSGMIVGTQWTFLMKFVPHRTFYEARLDHKARVSEVIVARQ